MNIWDFALLIILIIGILGFALGGFALYQKHKEEKGTN
jgi:hypothetical protein